MQPLRFSSVVAVWFGLVEVALAQQAPMAELLPKDDPFAVDEHDPEANLPSVEESNRRPLQFGYLLMELEDRATAARKRGDVESSVRFHRALTKLVPDRAVGFGLLCADYQTLGRREEALAACRNALGRSGAKTDDSARLVRLVAGRKDLVDPTELADAQAAIEHLLQTESTAVVGHELQCELSMAMDDGAGLARCTKELHRLAPNAARTIAFSWHLAARKNDLAGARALVQKAKQKQLPAEAVANMERATEALATEPAEVELTESSSNAWWLWLVTAIGAAALIGVTLARRLMRSSSSAP